MQIIHRSDKGLQESWCHPQKPSWDPLRNRSDTSDPHPYSVSAGPDRYLRDLGYGDPPLLQPAPLGRNTPHGWSVSQVHDQRQRCRHVSAAHRFEPLGSPSHLQLLLLHD